MRSLLLPTFNKAFRRGLHTTNRATCGFSRSYSQAAAVPSSNVTCKLPRKPSINCRIMLAFVSMTDSITTLPTEFLTAIEILSVRSEEHTSELQSRQYLVCRLLLEKKKKKNTQNNNMKCF